MIKISYEGGPNAVVVVFEGGIDAAQAQEALADLERVLPKGGEGFTLLVDYAAVDTMEPAVEAVVVKTMDFCNARGVTEVLRVLPDPAADLGFDILSREHYSKRVQIHTFRSRQEAQAFLQGARR